jgi:hypothetical protein
MNRTLLDKKSYLVGLIFSPDGSGILLFFFKKKKINGQQDKNSK